METCALIVDEEPAILIKTIMLIEYNSEFFVISTSLVGSLVPITSDFYTNMGNHVSPLLVLFPILITACICAEFMPAIVEGPAKAPIGCHKRLFTYLITQTDAKGFSCSDRINVNACWGRCDSKEISDWKFPFKKSHHPVCVPKELKKVFTILENCDPDAGMEARRYEYLEPVACSCQICSSINTSCESPQALHKSSVVRLIGPNVEESDNEYPIHQDK